MAEKWRAGTTAPVFIVIMMGCLLTGLLRMFIFTIIISAARHACKEQDINR